MIKTVVAVFLFAVLVGLLLPGFLGDHVRVEGTLVQYTPSGDRELSPGVYAAVPCSATIRLRDGSIWDTTDCFFVNKEIKTGDTVWVSAFLGIMTKKVRDVILVSDVKPDIARLH